MQFTENGRTGPRWIRETFAGCTGAFTVLPVVATLGLLAFAPLGPNAPQVALFAAFVTAGIGGLVHAFFSRTSLPATGPSSATALTLAALVAQLLADPRLLPARAPGLQALMALFGLSALLGGVLQIVFALLGAAACRPGAGAGTCRACGSCPGR
jgi:sulfate permease, SulP family